jgi:hypothetical protein
MNLMDIVKRNGFEFGEYSPEEGLLEHIISIDSPDQRVKDFFEKVVASFGLATDKLHFVFEDLKLNQGHALHTHLIPADMQMIVWFPKSEFEGREFQFGTKENLKKHTPKLGELCFMKTNDLDFIHGVTTLETDTIVRTLIISINCHGRLGEHLTIDAETLVPI